MITSETLFVLVITLKFFANDFTCMFDGSETAFI
jgi:hypothetical protein